MKESKDRIQHIINVYFNGNKKRFAEKVGSSAQAVNGWLRFGAGQNVLGKVKAAFPEIDPNWLYFGIGAAPMPNMPVEVHDSPKAQVNSPNAQIMESDTALVNALTQQIQDLKDQLDKKDEQIQNLIDLMMKKQ